MKTRGVLTLAFGRPKFIAMAKALARSIALHDPTLPLAIVTDSADPELATLFTHRIPHCRSFGSGVRQKMYLDLYSPFDETLFIDSDSFAVRALDPFWRAFEHVPFGVCGTRTLVAGDRDEYLDVDFTLQHFDLTSLPKFNGGVYYFDRSPQSEAIFTGARRLLRRASELHFEDHRGDGPCEEPLYSVAMAMHGLSGTDMGIGGMETLMDATSYLTMDIPYSICTFVKGGRSLAPDIIHFANFTDGRVYRNECRKLAVEARDRERLAAARARPPATALWRRGPWSQWLAHGRSDTSSLVSPPQALAPETDLRHKYLA